MSVELTSWFFAKRKELLIWKESYDHVRGISILTGEFVSMLTDNFVSILTGDYNSMMTGNIVSMNTGICDCLDRNLYSTIEWELCLNEYKGGGGGVAGVSNSLVGGFCNSAQNGRSFQHNITCQWGPLLVPFIIARPQMDVSCIAATFKKMKIEIVSINKDFKKAFVVVGELWLW